ncbi:MAG: hypothetical protein WBE76_11845 [Terracidiphilus sp.]
MESLNQDAAHTEAQESPTIRERESEINQEIGRLWSAQKDRDATARRTREELKALRRSLAEHLHEMKGLLVQTGRGGRWASYLREHRIPRATADRYVNLHESTLASSGEKRLTEAIPTSTEERVHLLFGKLLPRLRSVLTTQEAAFLFVCELICGLPDIQGDVTDSGAEVFRPAEESNSALLDGADVSQAPAVVF